MRRPLRSNVSRGRVAQTRAIPAPTGGWDTESPLSKMPARNAVILDNWIPRAASCELRRGFIQQATGTDEVAALIAWRGDPDGDKLFACSGSDIIDVTERGALGSTVWASATSARWKHCNFANDAGAFAICGNGQDVPIYYDGTGFNALTITASASSYSASALDCPMVHKRRIHWIQKGTLRNWYLGVNAIQGPAGLQDLGPNFSKGGHLVAQGSWSLDNGTGIDDMAVYVTSEGQVAVYQGTDPSDADAWALVGIYDLAKPLGDRPLIKWGSDLGVITEDGLLPLSQALNKDREEAKRIALTAQIASAFTKSAVSYGQNYGWCGTLYSGRGSLAIINIPTSELTSAVQYVQSIQTGAWSRFTGIPAICWEVANGEVYFGSTDGVYRWDVGSSDDSELIVADVKPAFSGFGYDATQKSFTMLQPLLKAPSIIRPALEMNVDYQESVPTAQPTVVAAGDIGTADQDAIRDDWTCVTGVGYVASPRMRISIVGDDATSLLAVDATDLIIDTTGGDNILVSPNLPLDVPVELIGFNVLFQPGGSL